MKDIEITNILKQLPLFKNLNNSDIDDAINYLDYNIVLLKKGEIIIKQDSLCNDLHILLSGTLEVNIVDALGNNILIEVLKGPRSFAIPHIFSGNDTFPATFTVKQDGYLLKSPKEKIFDLLAKYPDFLKNFLKERGNCNACTVVRLRILSYKSIRSRFSYYLIQHKIGNQLSIMEHNQTQLADYLGISRPALSAEIKKMTDEKIISLNKDEVVLLNINTLLSYI